MGQSLQQKEQVLIEKLAVMAGQSIPESAEERATDPLWRLQALRGVIALMNANTDRNLAIGQIKADAVREAVQEYKREYVGQGIETLFNAYADKLESGE